MTTEEITTLIQEFLTYHHIEVEGDGHHFFIRIVSDQFAGLTLLQRHRLIKDGLKEKIASNELHALSIVSVATPDEWQQKYNSFKRQNH